MRRHPSIPAGLLIILFLVSVAVLAPYITVHEPNRMGTGEPLEGPSREHPFGTDDFGRDVFSRVVFGGRTSLQAAFLVLIIAGPAGTTVGLISGFWGGRVDEIIMRLTDVFMSLPPLILAMAIATALGPSLRSAIVGVSLTVWTVYARLMRSGVLSEKEKEYVVAAKAIGAPPHRVLIRHILPNSASPVLIHSTLNMGTAILMAAGLSFVGAGVQPPTPEWGALVAEGRHYMGTAWWMATFPGLAIFAGVVGFSILGDGLRDALDPRLRHVR